MSLSIVILFQLLLAFGIEAKIYAWGVNDYGQLGVNGTYTKYPQEILNYKNVNIVNLKASGTYHMAVTDTGDVYVSGNNWYGGLALPVTSRIFVGYPTKNSDLKDCNVYVGKRHGNAVCGNKFYGWGVQSGYVGGLTKGISGKRLESLSQYQFGSNVASVIAGSRFSYVTLTNGSIFVAGSGEGGILGLGDTKDRPIFQRFEFFDSVPLLKIFPSHAEHICALSQNYSLYCWGSNTVGQLGLGDRVNRTIPTLVSFFESKYYVVQVATCLYHTIALTASGKVFVWGLATNGVLGNGQDDNTTAISTPIEVTPLGDKNVVEVVCGLNFNYVRTGSNSWYSWGAGSGGVLGSKNDENVYNPTTVTFMKTFNITSIYTASTSRSIYGWLDPSAPTSISGPELENECLEEGLIQCSSNAHCVDTDRYAECACDSGFTGEPDNCVDINECLSSVCVPSATCTNTAGSYFCTCPSNLPVGDGKISGSGCKALPPIATTTTTTSTTSASVTTSAGQGSGVSPNTGTTTDESSISTSDGTTTASDGQGSGVSPNSGTTTVSGSEGTTTGSQGTTTGDGATGKPVGSTTRRTNYYQTLSGVKDLDEPEESDSAADDSFLENPNVNTDGGDDDKTIMIVVLVIFAALVAIALLVGLYIYVTRR